MGKRLRERKGSGVSEPEEEVRSEEREVIINCLLMG